MSHVGAVLRDCRLKQNLSQGDVAKYFKLASAQFISNLERGIGSLPAKMVPGLSWLLRCPRSVLIEAQVLDYEADYKAKVAKFRKQAMSLMKGSK